MLKEPMLMKKMNKSLKKKALDKSSLVFNNGNPSHKLTETRLCIWNRLFFFLSS